MVKITVTLSEQEYSDNLLLFFMNRIYFKLISNMLLFFIITALAVKITNPDMIETTIIIIWFVLWAFYTFMIPHLIKKRTQVIYQNTLFLKEDMSFEFSESSIIWTTSKGVQQTTFANIYQIKTTATALIISFSPHQVLPIPYNYITPAQWEQLLTIIKQAYKKQKINSAYYTKYLKGM